MKKRRMGGFTPLDRWRHLTGFTLIEVMISMAIFAGTLAAFAGVYATTTRLNESGRNLTQAMNDARVVMEAIRDTAQSGGLTGASGVTGVYPQGNNLAAALGLNSLQNETIRATYSGVDPLQVTLQIDWDQGVHSRDPITMETLITRRQSP